MLENERSWIEINLSNYEDNLKELKKFLTPEQKFLQIIKADAYGHGGYQIGKYAIKNGAAMLGVASVDEALLIRYHDVSTPILLLSPSLESELPDIVKYQLIPTVNDLDFAHKLNNLAKQAKQTVQIHLNLDTGMNRSGIRADEAYAFCEELLSLEHLVIDGMFTHFAESEVNHEFTNQQYALFCTTVDQILAGFTQIKPTYFHASNSCGVVNFHFERMNLVRLGILTFGIYPHPSLKQVVAVKPVMKFITNITQLKSAKVGESISYNRTFYPDKSLDYAILPIGYADGYNFLLSNKGRVLYKDRLLPVVGKVTMDMISVDVSNLDNPQIGETVILFGEEALRLEDLTALYAGSPYELATQTGKRAKRYYYYGDKVVASEPRLRREFYSRDFTDKSLSAVIQDALKTRINSNEISQVLFNKIINNFIQEADSNISYRTGFDHKIKFTSDSQNSEFYQVETELRYSKRLAANSFLIACATDSETLNQYFRNPLVEYRWLLSNELSLTPNSFVITEVTVNDVPAQIKLNSNSSVLEYSCSNDEWSDFIGKKCEFYIKTKTLYPKSSHQLSVFISEPTKGVKITFEYPHRISNIETVTFFTGDSQDPTIHTQQGTVTVESEANNWILPTSGVIFAY